MAEGPQLSGSIESATLLRCPHDIFASQDATSDATPWEAYTERKPSQEEGDTWAEGQTKLVFKVHPLLALNKWIEQRDAVVRAWPEDAKFTVKDPPNSLSGTVMNLKNEQYDFCVDNSTRKLLGSSRIRLRYHV